MLIENINQVITKYITNDIIRHMIQIASSEFCMILWSIKLKTIQTHINFKSTRNIQICFDNNYLLRNHDNGRVACATAVTQLSFVVVASYGYITLIFWLQYYETWVAYILLRVAHLQCNWYPRKGCIQEGKNGEFY